MFNSHSNSQLSEKAFLVFSTSQERRVFSYVSILKMADPL